MTTKVSIDAQLLERAFKVSGERTRRAAPAKALREFIARRQQMKVLELFGQLEWDSSFAFKEERSRP